MVASSELGSADRFNCRINLNPWQCQRARAEGVHAKPPRRASRSAQKCNAVGWTDLLGLLELTGGQPSNCSRLIVIALPDMRLRLFEPLPRKTQITA
jgi:hypothetical protein